MKKCLLLVALLAVSQLNNINAQGLFNAPDTVCIKQPVQLSSNVKGATSYYWNFCSGYLINPPVGDTLGSGFSFNRPADIDIAKDTKDSNYYGFVINNATNEFLRLNYGRSLGNVPTVTNYGNLTNGLPANPNSMYVTRDTASGNWFVFVTGGVDSASSTLARIDFGASLGSAAPNVVNMGNLNHLLNKPTGIFVAKEGSSYYGYVLNNGNSHLIRLEFSHNISNTPLLYDDGDLMGAIGRPTDIAAIKDNDGNWIFFVTNLAYPSITRIDIGTLANTAPTAVNLGNINGTISNPTAISLALDCGNYYAYVINDTFRTFVRIQMPALTGPYTATDYGDVDSSLNRPTGLSKIIRDHGDLYCFTTDSGNNSLTRIRFPQCNNTNIASSDSLIPPVYAYDTPGVYNVYFAIDEGLPTMQSYCKTITALPIPSLIISPDTLICERDTVAIYVISQTAIGYQFTPDYDIVNTMDSVAFVYPDMNTTYHVIITYPHGCIVDTPITVDVRKVRADAGPDRTIADGATTILGGPYSYTDSVTYTWSPNEFLSDPSIANPTAKPLFDITYYLKVTEFQDSLKCADIDTVTVHLACLTLNVPNAFAPASTAAGANRFGILNYEVVKLNYLRVFDRWGRKVFETADPTEKWDGKVDGDYVQPGVYVWEADAFCQSGQRITQKGNVTMIR